MTNKKKKVLNYGRETRPVEIIVFLRLTEEKTHKQDRERRTR